VKSGELRDDLLLSTEETLTDLGLAESAAKWVPSGSILIAMYGATVGKTALLGIDATTNQAVCSLVPNPEVADNRYLWYAIRASVPKFLAKRVGGAQPNISQKIIRETFLSIPALSEQRRIVKILDQADALRRKRAVAEAKAARILPALFYKMFGDPATNPKGWPTTSLGDVAIDLRYGTSVKCIDEGARWPVLRIPNVLGGRIDTSELKYADLPESEVAKLRLEDGDILFVRSNGNRDYVGGCAVFELGGDFLYASYLIRVRVDRSRVNPKFIKAILGTPVGRKSMSPFIRTTAGQSNISQEGIRQIPLILPPLEIQNQFCHRVAHLERLVQERQIRAQKMEVLFQTLNHQAFLGDLTAKWREVHMNELSAEIEFQAKALFNP
jgi:type I restriction enzyme S subunit